MRTLAAIEADLDAAAATVDAPQHLLRLADEVLEQWVVARGQEPTMETSEGFRLLALHRQGARGVASFNACRETCREVAYHYNLLRTAPDPAQDARRRLMMAMLVRHLALFVGGKLQAEGLGEFCCAARPLRQEPTVQP